MVLDQWSEVLRTSFQDLWSGVVNVVPNLIIALLIIIIGWIIGALVGRVVAQLIRSIKVDEGLRRAGVEDILQKGGVSLDSGSFLGILVKWFIIVVFLIAAFNVLGLTQVNEFLRDVVLYLPRVIVAVLVLLVAGVLGDVMRRVVVTSAQGAGFGFAGFLGKVTKWAIWIFAILVALDQLGIGSAFVQTLFTGIVIAFSLALGLSFGLGGQEAAARFIERTRQEMGSHHK